ncbi:MAG: hypothetical protein IJG45_05785 [Oscillospiraceae bacterium]|nr:hypothetical protein [Oscillospiraceae bacterium]
MKKTYQKPELLFEDFTLMDAIAATCGPNGNGNAVLKQGDVYTCYAIDYDLEWQILMNSAVGCLEIIDDIVAAATGTQTS